MNFDDAISEPLARLIDFHNGFNRSIKLSFGALSLLPDRADDMSTGVPVSLPTGSEPWGRETLWRDLEGPLKDAAIFLAELGIARAVAAFEDYYVSAKAEFDRAALQEARPKKEGTRALHGFDATVGFEGPQLDAVICLAEFFDTARNCVVHRSNRASPDLAKQRAAPELANALAVLPKRVGKWTVSLPPVTAGEVVEWRPRHAILASDIYYRAAVHLDRILVRRLKPVGMARMAAHWCFFADPLAPCHAKHSPERMIRAQLDRRYKVRELSEADAVMLLREADVWDDARAAWTKLYPDGPDTAQSRHRRARKTGK